MPRSRSEQEAIAIRPTAFFEGGTPTGNFDGMGLSMGTIQPNLGQGTLQPLLLDMHAADPARFEHICGKALAAEILKVCVGPIRAAVAWGDAHSTGPEKQYVKEPLRSALIALWKEPVFQACERRALEPYMADARKDAAYYGVMTVRGLAEMFDTAVQRGPAALGPTARAEVAKAFAAKGGHALPYRQKLIALAQVQADQCTVPANRPLCLSRRMAIALGRGTVYGSPIDLDRRFGLNDEVLA